MKKMIATLLALALALSLGLTAVAEESARTLVAGTQFNMDMDQVIGQMNLPNYEIEKEKTRGTTEFWELDYENVKASDGYTCDMKFIFVGNSLVAVKYDFKDGTSYDAVKTMMAGYGTAVPFDAAKIGNGKYAVDDDGDLKDCKEMIEADGLTIILEQDKDGDVDVTFLDPTAAYINN